MPGPGDIRAGGAFVELYADDAALQRGLAMAQRRLRSFANTVQGIGRSLVAGGIGAGFFSGLSANTFAKFERTMLAIRGITQSTTGEFKKLNDVAANLGRQTSFTAIEISEAMVELARSGADAAEIISTIRPVLNLARGTMTDLNTATQTVVTTMNQFGISAAEAGRVTDVLAITANNSVQTVEDLAEALKYAGPQFNQANHAIEDTAAFLGILADAGIKGTLAGTQLRRVLLNLSKIDTQKRLAQEPFGIQVGDPETREFRGMSVLMNELADASQRLGSADLLGVFDELFGRGQNAALLSSLNADKIQEFLAKFKELRGEAGRLRDEQEEGLLGFIERTKSAFEGVQLSLGQAMSGWLKGVLDGVTEVLVALSQWIDKNREVGATIANVVVGITALGASLTLIGIGARAFAFLSEAAAGTAAFMGRLGEKFIGVHKIVSQFTQFSVVSLARVGTSINHLIRGTSTLQGQFNYLKRYSPQDAKNLLDPRIIEAFRGLTSVLGYSREMIERVYLSMKHLVKGTSTLDAQIRYLTKANKSLIWSFGTMSAGAATAFRAIIAGARAAAMAVKALTAAALGFVEFFVILKITEWLFDAADATWNWVMGVSDLDKAFQKFDDSKMVSSAYHAERAASTFENLAQSTVRTADQQARFAAAVQLLTNEFGELNLEIDEATGEVKNFDAAMESLRARQNATEELGRSFASMREELKYLNEELESRGVNPEEEASNVDFTYRRTSYGEQTTEIDQLIARKQKLVEMMHKYSDSIDTATFKMDKQTQRMLEQKQAADELRLAAAKKPKESLADIDARVKATEDLVKMEQDAALKVKELQIKVQHDGYREELMLLRLRRSELFEQAKALGLQVPTLNKVIALERELLKQKEQQRQAEALASATQDAEFARAELDLEGLPLIERRLELERAAAIEAAKQAGYAEDVLNKIRETYDLRKKAAQQDDADRKLEEQAKEAERLAEAAKDADLEMARLKVELNIDDEIAKRYALLDIEEEAALVAARRAKEELDTVKEIYALKRQVLDKEIQAEEAKKRAERLKAEQEAAEKLAEANRPDILGGTFQGRLAPLILGDGDVQKSQLDALKDLLDEQEKTRQELGQALGNLKGGLIGV